MVWTLPAITNTQLSSVKIFNNGQPIELITEAIVDKQDQDYTDVFNTSPNTFFSNMATELMYLLQVLLKKNPSPPPPTSIYQLLIENNRLVYIGFAILVLTTSIWIIVNIFFRTNPNKST